MYVYERFFFKQPTTNIESNGTDMPQGQEEFT